MSSEAPSRSTGPVLRFSGFRRTVRDLDRSREFYTSALDFVVDLHGDVHGDGEPADPFTEAADGPTAARLQLRLGAESMQLFTPGRGEFAADAPQPASGVSDAAFQHLAIVVDDMRAALDRLARHAPSAISADGAVHLPQSSGGAIAFKFRDPDGHPLELIEFPPGGGDPRWHRGTRGGPTLGIDHSAISVTNAERSLRFYVDTLGFRCVSRQVNRGVEQASLDGVPQAVVDVIGLAPTARQTPHLELLAYSTPPARPASRSPALMEDRSDRMTFDVDDLAAMASRLRRARRPFMADTSPRRSCLLLHDDDGHLLLLRQLARAEMRPD